MQGFENYACNIIVLAHTTPTASRDFGSWRQSLLTELERIARKHGAQLNHQRQVHPAAHSLDGDLTAVMSDRRCVARAAFGVSVSFLRTWEEHL